MIRSTLLILLFVFGTAKAQLLQDPTRPPLRVTVGQSDSTNPVEEVAAVDGIPHAVVTAIFVSEISRYAIINNDMVSEGETWRNVLLAKVNHDSVELSNGDNRKVVRIFNTEIAKERDYVY